MDNEIKKFLACLTMDRRIVGVKFLFNEKEYEQSDVKPAKTKLSYCMMVNIATSGKSIKVRNEHFWCNSSARAFGIKEVDEKVKAGIEYFSYGLYNSLGTARKVFDEVVYLNHNVYGLELRPIEEFKDEPQVVIAISKPYNIMRIMQGYSYEFGFAKNIRFAGNQGVCSELTTRPYMNNDINISVLCSNTRHSCNWKDDEIGVGMPYSIFKKVVNGVLETTNSVESDYRKDKIIEKAKKENLDINIKKGENYYGSCLGVARLD